ncbi:Bifunctional polynucleotide phosphatase/kinase [Thalictrum thalictroides]|uniref:Bifunctional polynucleotide phosphatase/kinase n=1 Tax=Thalictrum thalictroides TaxID=46969 RepID=A0A7J6WHA5_THATH|nr:Bifunctional polynucleotide phosphatase/kinase [Thalictrum thalictroides]
MASSKIIAEYAKSNRSSCKKCSKPISANTLRLGLVVKDPRGFDIPKWHHLNCFPSSQSTKPVENINGFSSLKSDDQVALKNFAKESKVRKHEEIEDNGGVVKEGSVKKAKDSEEEVEDIEFSESEAKSEYKGVALLPKWKAFETVIFLEKDEIVNDSGKIAAFDFDGCLAKTSVRKVGAEAWSLMFESIPEKLKKLYEDGFKVVIFTNESNIDRWKNKRERAIDSKIGRLNNFIKKVEVPVQVFIACGYGEEDRYRKPKVGMWRLMEKSLNSGIKIDMEESFYVGDAAGRVDDHSDADIKFAETLGLKFHLPEDYFAV